uniref:Uncharacterized protein n=1 Tax=Molossus molossus TaxID=27622 RepID=A0A7J8F9T3_MOLMO|nr:hypothetical protein HJG59_008616 [Molossus molossus]
MILSLPPALSEQNMEKCPRVREKKRKKKCFPKPRAASVNNPSTNPPQSPKSSSRQAPSRPRGQFLWRQVPSRPHRAPEGSEARPYAPAAATQVPLTGRAARLSLAGRQSPETKGGRPTDKASPALEARFPRGRRRGSAPSLRKPLHPPAGSWAAQPWLSPLGLKQPGRGLRAGMTNPRPGVFRNDLPDTRHHHSRLPQRTEAICHDSADPSGETPPRLPKAASEPSQPCVVQGHQG